MLFRIFCLIIQSYLFFCSLFLLFRIANYYGSFSRTAGAGDNIKMSSCSIFGDYCISFRGIKKKKLIVRCVLLFTNTPWCDSVAVRNCAVTHLCI